MSEVHGVGEALAAEIGSIAMPRFYRTPELVSRARGGNNNVTTASDIFQLGTIIYEITTGFNPQQQPVELTDDIVFDARPISGDQGAQLYNLILRMLRTNPQERPTAEEVRDALVQIHRDYCFRLRDLTGRFV